MENLLKEIQNLSKRYEEDRKDMNEGLEMVQDIADTMRKDLKAINVEWGDKWNEIEKRDEERNAKQDRMGERLCKLEEMIKEKGEAMEIVQDQEKEKKREDTIKELTWRLEETGKEPEKTTSSFMGKYGKEKI
ncbi:hypothetical protein QAD02_002553 [Eretmocerus hayati]|uniref:Uncharacterized protein n=1 Tax=Eretmocerus hayati TaxID=131215 RepID=A0ACC2NJJ2_9HYME|nr:hypothetical protein QAD02_002553 [Eretmocerus hayati]